MNTRSSYTSLPISISVYTYYSLSFVNGSTVQYRSCTTQDICLSRKSFMMFQPNYGAMGMNSVSYNRLSLTAKYICTIILVEPIAHHTPTLPYNGTLWINTKFSAHHYLSFQKFTYVPRRNQVPQIQKKCVVPFSIIHYMKGNSSQH